MVFVSSISGAGYLLLMFILTKLYWEKIVRIGVVASHKLATKTCLSCMMPFQIIGKGLLCVPWAVLCPITGLGA